MLKIYALSYNPLIVNQIFFQLRQKKTSKLCASDTLPEGFLMISNIYIINIGLSVSAAVLSIMINLSG